MPLHATPTHTRSYSLDLDLPNNHMAGGSSIVVDMVENPVVNPITGASRSAAAV